ncbi:Na+/H+ antiporter [Streptomyces sp. L-9-10]|uniref:cation:proton antiporter domain-containing protein n=1 Tax=Streptomyces sp. L-9-10 TaxID=1478131 RepID=UPI00101BB0BE|nr:cation:proton antiporter [Streptomyces sp. L-9-10]RYJ31782.1 Na+/H+ antiporter [Streptomyces sp. L-9-10]
MDGIFSLILLLLFLWGLFSQRLARVELTAPVAFVLLGLLLSEGLGVLDLAPSPETVRTLAEVTLAWVLFTDAARLSFRALRPELGLYVRLLLLGLPLCIGLGTLLAVGLLPGVSGWAALYVAAALAPTDAALGATMMVDPVVPARIRRLINVESGLNDGIATPFVVLALAGVAAAGSTSDTHTPGSALVELAIGLGYGTVLGLIAGRGLRIALRKGWATEDVAGTGVLALALLSYTSAIAIGGNGFVAAFVAGLAFGSTHGARQRVLLFVEQSASLFSVLVWLLFGAVLVPAAFEHLTWQAALYAVLSLTVVRMLPVALSLTGSGLDRKTLLFVGWFGPRGLASVIFGLLAVEELAPPAWQSIVPVVVCTVLLSVVAHGISSAPLAQRYGRASAATGTPPARPEGPAENDLPIRGMGTGTIGARRHGRRDGHT